MKRHLLAMLCLLFAGTVAYAQKKRVNPNPKLDSGKTFHFVDMTDIDGNIIKASSLAGKTVVLNCWFIGCMSCEDEMPLLSKIAKAHKDNKEMVFISLAPNTVPGLKDHFKRRPFSFRQVGNAKLLLEDMGVSMYPVNLIIDKTGTIVFNSNNYFVMQAVALMEQRLKNM